MIRKPSSQARHTDGGFTLVELLVVIAIIAVLVLLLLPAINAAREAARNSQCKNNIRQLALALVNYESTHGHFPISQTASGKDRPGKSCQPGFYSWQARILPFVEENVLYEQIDFSLDMADECSDGESALISSDHPNAIAAATLVPIFLCPSDGRTGHNAETMGTANPASDNYAGNAGWPSLTTGYIGERETPARYNGLINLNNPRTSNTWQPKRPVRAKDITDGLSKTGAVAERLIQRGVTRDQILNGSERLKSFHITEHPRTLAQMCQRCDAQYTHADLPYSTYLGRAWISGWVPTAPTYMHLKQPNSNHCHFGCSITTGDFIVTPSSNHAGGVNVAFADAHVEFIPDDIDQTVWWAMGSRNGRDSAQRARR